MQKKQNLKKSKKCQQVHGCMICKIARIPFLVTISSIILLEKYCRPLQKSIYISLLQPLMVPNSHKLRIKYREVQILTRKEENLKEYNNFSSIIAKIKPVILERIKKDKLIPMHYHEQNHGVMLVHSLLKRKINSIKLKPLKHEKTQSTDEDQQNSKIKAPAARKKVLPNETASMRRLTRSLSTMVQKFEEQCDFHSSFIFELMNLASRHAVDYTREGEQEMFKKQLENNNISQIRSKYQIERLPTNPESVSRKFEENYGFQPRQKNIAEEYKVMIGERRRVGSPNSGKLMKQNIPQRIQTDYDCQAIKKSKKKTSISSSKKSNDKFSKKFLGSMSKKKDSKISSIAKSRVKCG